jgi:DNA-binding XRE family transcriptional regulator
MFSHKPPVKDELDIPHDTYQYAPAWLFRFVFGRLVFSLSMSSSHARTQRLDVTLHNRLARLRVEQGMSRQDLASVLDISHQTVIALEHGEYTPSLDLALRLGQLFALPLEEIFFLSNVDHGMRKTVKGECHEPLS